MSKDVVEQKQIKVVEVLSASDLNPKYLNCVELYITSWLSIPTKNQVKFIPKVMIVANAIPESLSEYSEYLQLITPEDMPTSFVSQTSRIVEGRNSMADFVMTSDIDMLPLNVDFEFMLVHSKNFDSGVFFILRDVLAPGQYPICYNLAKPQVWRSLTSSYGDSSPTSKILRAILDDFGGDLSYSGLYGGSGWTIDQQALWSLVQGNVGKIQFEKFVDAQTRHHRLDRNHHTGFLKWLVLPLVFLGFYHDYHVHHPIVENMRYSRIVLRIRNLGLSLRHS